MPGGSSGLYTFGCYRLDPVSRTLTRLGDPVPLPPKTFDLLVLLAGSDGRLLTRSELMTALWPDATVEEGSLTFQISALRKALGEDAWIENVPKHGYRFHAPVQRQPAPVEAPVAQKPGLTPRTANAWAVAAILVAVAALYWVYRSSGSPVGSSGAIYQPVRITSYPGFEEWPDVSPDGSQVAFAWDGPAGDNYDIYVKLAGPGDPLRLTDNPGRDISPAWSPDGRWIAFVRFAPAAGPVRLLEPERADVYVKPALGGVERRVYQGWTTFPLIEYPRKLLTWTPDGKSIIVAARPGPETRRGLWLVPTSGGDANQLTMVPDGFGETSPSFSPDGHCLAFFRTQGTRVHVYVLRMKGDKPDGSARRITSESRGPGSLAWTPNGGSILTSSGAHTGFRGLRRIIMTAECGSASREESLPFGEQVTTFGLSKTGRLVYAQQMRAASLWRWDTSGNGNPIQVFNSTQDDHTPAYSPDGQRIAFASTRSGSEEIWLSNADGSHPIQLTFMNGPTTSTPQFSPDGQKILFNSRKEGRSDLYTIELSSGTLKRITSHPEEEIQASWSRDGAFIYFASDFLSSPASWQIHRMPADGGPWVQVTRNGGLFAQESLDGKTLYFSDDNALWSLPAAEIGSGRTNPVKLADGLVYGLNFGVTANGIYYMSAGPSPRQSTIRFFDFQTRKSQSVLQMDKLWWFGLTVSPDQRSVLYSVRDQDGTDLLLVDHVQ
jgi:Tol biopolymer transport system component/DNA-binding winged helix-turn-helix (wHTH) protein